MIYDFMSNISIPEVLEPGMECPGAESSAKGARERTFVKIYGSSNKLY